MLTPGRHIAIVLPEKESKRPPVQVVPKGEKVVQIHVCFKVIRREVGDTWLFEDLPRPETIWWYQAITSTTGKVIPAALKILEDKRLFGWDRQSFGGLIKTYPALRCCLTLDYKNATDKWQRVMYVDPVDSMDRPIVPNSAPAEKPDDLDARFGAGVLKGGGT